MATEGAQPVKRFSLLGARRHVALHEATWAWAISRALCWAAGVAGVLVLGAHAGPHDPGHLTAPFGTLGNDLVAPAARWDSHWYLLIAEHGYVTPSVTHFYPFYPLLARVVGTPVGSALIGGIIVSLGASLVGLRLLQQLATLELGAEQAVKATVLLAFFPVAVFFSAVYTEGLFLAVTVGAVYAARTGRWPAAGIAGGLAAMTRPTGIEIIVPLALLYLFGPRADRDEPGCATWWRPRHRPGPEALWLLAVPAGLALYMVYLALTHGDPLLMLHQHKAWDQHLTIPVVKFAQAASGAANGLAHAVHGHAPHNVYEFVVLCLAIVATVGALRRLPLAYGAYAAVAILVFLTFPAEGAPGLGSSNRYLAPLFPLFMWFAPWLSRRRLYVPVLALSALLMMVFSARFATWHFIG